MINILPPELAINGNFRVSEGPLRQWFTGTGPRRVLLLKHITIENTGEVAIVIEGNRQAPATGLPGGYFSDVLSLELWDANATAPIIDGPKPWPASALHAVLHGGGTVTLPTWYPAFLIDLTDLPADGAYTLRVAFNPQNGTDRGREVFFPLVLTQTDPRYTTLNPDAVISRELPF